MSSIKEAIQDNNPHAVSRLLLDSAIRNVPVMYTQDEYGKPEYVCVDRVLERAAKDGENAYTVVEQGRQLCVKKKIAFSK